MTTAWKIIFIAFALALLATMVWPDSPNMEHIATVLGYVNLFVDCPTVIVNMGIILAAMAAWWLIRSTLSLMK